ncbi:hypothetical protein DFJ73DRAFT_514078 [Zopfochytrium polystomum]|nr:hypothetical protein DFJ73DRAFT_514078 [Zopfochytrium polystomum]
MMTTEAAAASPDSPLPQHHQSQQLEQRYSYILPVLAPIHPAAAPTPNITTAAVAAAAATMHGVSPTSAVAAPSAPASGGGVFVGPYSDSVDVHHEQQQHQQQQLQLQLQLLQQQQQQQQQQQFLQLQYHQQQQNLLLLQQQLLQQQQQDPQPQSSTFAAPGLPAPNIMPFYLYQLPQQSPINPYPFAQGPSGPATGMMAVSSPMLPTAIPLQMGPQLMATPVPGSPISYLAPNSTISKRPSLAPSVATSVISTDVVVSAGSTTNQYMSQQQTQDAKRAPSIISLPSSTIASSRPASVLRSSSIIEHTRAYHPQPLPTLPEENSVRSTTPEVPIANSRANSRSYFFYPDSLQHGHDSKGSVPSVTALPRTTTVPPGNSFVVPPMSMSPLPETPLTATPLTETPPTPVMNTPPPVAESTAAVLSDRSVPSVAESMERAISSPAVSPPASRPTSPISTESVLLLSPSTSPSILANSVLTVKHLGKKAKRSVILCAPKTNDDIISVRNTIAMMERAKHLSALDDALAFGSEEGVSRDSSFFPVRLGSNAAMRGGRDSEIELYGHLAYAALTGDALIILGTGTRTYIHMSRISSVLNESDLSTPCHFAIDIDKLHYRFSSHSSPDYQNWIQKLTAEFDKTHSSETSSSADITVTPRERVPLNARTEKGERQRGESSFSPVASEARQKKPAPEKRRSRSNSRPSPPDSRPDGHRKRSNSNPRPKESKMSDASLESLADRKQPGSPPSMSRALPRSRSATLSSAVKGHGNIEEEAKMAKTQP